MRPRQSASAHGNRCIGSQSYPVHLFITRQVYNGVGRKSFGFPGLQCHWMRRGMEPYASKADKEISHRVAPTYRIAYGVVSTCQRDCKFSVRVYLTYRRRQIGSLKALPHSTSSNRTLSALKDPTSKTPRLIAADKQCSHLRNIQSHAKITC